MSRYKICSNKLWSLWIIILLLPLASCMSSTSTTEPGYAVNPQKIIVNPPCGPAINSETTEYLGPLVPGNADTLTDFNLLLPQQLPHNLTWNALTLLSKRWSQGVAPLFHVSYGIWIKSEGSSSLHPAGSLGLHQVLAIDETTARLLTLANISTDSPLKISKQTITTHIGVNKASLLHFKTLSGITEVSQVIWHSGITTIRITVVTKGTFSFKDGGVSDLFVDQGDMSDTVLLQLARSVVPYTRCEA